MDDDRPDDDIARLEERIEALAATLESCRKLILAAKIALALGGALLALVLFGIVRFDPALLVAGAAAVLGGIVVMGSNSRTANDTVALIDALEAQRAALIDALDLRAVEAVEDRPTLH